MSDVPDALPRTPPRTGQAPVPRQPDAVSELELRKGSIGRKRGMGLLPEISLYDYRVSDRLLDSVFRRTGGNG